MACVRLLLFVEIQKFLNYEKSITFFPFITCRERFGTK